MADRVALGIVLQELRASASRLDNAVPAYSLVVNTIELAVFVSPGSGEGEDVDVATTDRPTASATLPTTCDQLAFQGPG